MTIAVNNKKYTVIDTYIPHIAPPMGSTFIRNIRLYISISENYGKC